MYLKLEKRILLKEIRDQRKSFKRICDLIRKHGQRSMFNKKERYQLIINNKHFDYLESGELLVTTKSNYYQISLDFGIVNVYNANRLKIKKRATAFLVGMEKYIKVFLFS